ncbi:CidA/LrgA family protein [Tistrella sp. BH-R2-4]|uniref:CidA/LrgA family protein n=1 Tax=Tistrella arctica TaxID=3133430 RepID=A0ABU9YFR0_9PROT
MRRQRLAAAIRHTLHRNRLVQIALLAGFWACGEALVRQLHLPVPGGIIGMAVVLVLLATHRIRPDTLGRGAKWLLAEMLLFFVPAVMALLDHHEFIGALGLKLLAVILTGTLMVMASTALTVELFFRLRTRHDPA